jgi:hypothetical protein
MIMLSSSSDVCSWSDVFQHPGETAMLLMVSMASTTMPNTSTAPPVPGTYTIIDSVTPPAPGDRRATISTNTFEAGCHDSGEHDTVGVSGSITVTRVADGILDGTFDVMLSSGDHITGTFEPVMCDALAGPPGVRVPPVCKP